MKLLQKYFFKSIGFSPSLGSFIGFRKYDHDYFGPPRVEAQKQMNVVDSKFKRLLKKASNSNFDIENETLRYLLYSGRKNKVTSYMPINSFNFPVIIFTMDNMRFYPLKTKRDLICLIKRHARFPRVVKEAIQDMKRGVKKRITIPHRICKSCIDLLDSFIEKGQYKISIPTQLQKRYPKLYESYLEIMRVHGEVLVSLNSFLRDYYLKKCRKTIGLCHIRNKVNKLYDGRHCYKTMVSRQLSMKMHPDEIHKIGLQEVQRVYGELQETKKKLGYGSLSMKAFYRAMLTDQKYKFKSREAVINAFVDKREELYKTIVPKYFYSNVDKYAIIHANESANAAAYYYPGNQRSKRKGAFYVNLRNIDEHPKYSITALSLHEGVPGHHYQFQYMVQKQIPYYKYYMVSTAFVEGWALYAESLYDYDNHPLDYFGKLTYEMFRSVRLVVDTGIHWKGWSYDRALAYMKKYIAMVDSELEAELDRYICWPAQALTYKIGELTIRKWKEEFIHKFGDSPDSIKKFHELLLEDGVLPMQVLERKLFTFIKHS